jgi:hypothetical protein
MYKINDLSVDIISRDYGDIKRGNKINDKGINIFSVCEEAF